MKKLLLFSTLLLFPLIMTYGQDETIAAQFAKAVEVPNSPEAEAFSKYGDVDVNLHSGQANIAVPLYTIKGRELDLPISLTYDASGIKVDQVASNVGLGWNLNVGGRISKSVQGNTDYYTSVTGSYESIKDLSVRNKINLYKGYNGTNDDFFYDSNFNNVVTAVTDYYEFLRDVSNGDIDIEQDYYSLNVLGLNETIWIDLSTNEPRAINNNNIKVEWLYFLGDITGWKVTDEQGNQYFFGALDWDSRPDPFLPGENIEMVRRENFNDKHSTVNLSTDYNSSWLLNKIISSKGKDVYHFSYTANETLNDPDTFSRRNQMITHELKSIPCSFLFYEYENYNSSNLYGVTSVKSSYTQQYLKAIYHNGKEVVKFDFENRTDLDNGTNKAVSGFSVYEDFASSQTAIYKTDFDYSYFGDEQSQLYYEKRLKLDKVTFGVNQVKNFYEFDYTSPEQVPGRDSFSKDILGYFNGETTSIAYREWTGYGQSGNYTLNGADREVNENTSDIGILKRMYYPTGGYTDFVYENHTDGTEKFPGLRIQKITNYTDQSIIATTKEYEYGTIHKNYQPLLDIEVYRQANLTLTCPCSPNSSLREHPNPKILQRYANPPNVGSGPYITYDDVIERNTVGGVSKGYSKYTFISEEEGWTPTNTLPFENNYYSSYKNGKVNLKTTRDSSNILLQTENTTYTSEIPYSETYLDTALVLNQNLATKYSYVRITNYGSYIDIEKPAMVTWNCTFNIDQDCYNNPDVHCFVQPEYGSLEARLITINGYSGGVAQVVKTEHYPTGDIVSTTDNEFVPNRMFLKSSTSTINNGDSIKKEYTYPLDIDPNLRTAAEIKLIDQNKLTVPIVTKNWKLYPSASDKLLSTQKVVYELWNNNTDPLPKYVKTEKGGTGSNLEVRIIYQNYDEDNNITDVLLADGAHISYIWGYDGKYVVAKIENKAYSNITPILISNIQDASINGSEEDLNDELDILRNSLTDALVTSYTYKPLIGVSTITDPKGDRVKFFYDQHNRLEFVKDANDKLVGKNEYNYRINN